MNRETVIVPVRIGLIEFLQCLDDCGEWTAAELVIRAVNVRGCGVVWPSTSRDAVSHLNPS